MKALNLKDIKEVSGGLETGGNVSVSIPCYAIALPQAISFITALGGTNTTDELKQISSAFISAGIDPNTVNIYFSYRHEG